jgi:hypothetical protein
VIDGRNLKADAELSDKINPVTRTVHSEVIHECVRLMDVIEEILEGRIQIWRGPLDSILVHVDINMSQRSSYEYGVVYM